MPDEYIDVPIEFDETALYNQAVVRIQDSFPEWEPVRGSLVDITLRSCATMAAVGADVASSVPFTIFKALLNWLGYPALEAVPATVYDRFIAWDNSGHVVPPLTPVGLSTGSLELAVGFQTLGPGVILPGATNYVDVACIAVTPGVIGNNLTQVVRVDALGFIQEVVISPLNTASAGGIDPEADADFANRGAQDLETWTETPILGRDFALLARKIPGIYRCAWIDNYNPATNSYTTEKMVAICPIDANGLAPSPDVQQQVKAYLESLRELNFVCNVMEPSYTQISVSVVVHIADPAQATAIAVQSQVEDAIARYINPATWGIPTTGRGLQLSPIWVNQSVLRYSKVMTAIESVPDVDYAENLFFGWTLGTWGGLSRAQITWADLAQDYGSWRELAGSFHTGDITLEGVFTLPLLANVSVTVISP
jgi:hypothetical protein